ncbi:hypothetical protein G6F22_015968 [Rhizopus arrhizus]|nr:hypothetical protein G6F22_015968 [Rhizopus arrhizus]
MRQRGSRRAPGACSTPAAQRGPAATVLFPLALHRQRRPACPVRSPAPDSVRRMRRRREWHRRKPCRRPSRERSPAAGSSPASVSAAPGAYRRGSGASGRGGARMRRPPRRAAGRRPGRAAPPHRDRGTRPDARRAHPGRDLPAGAIPSARRPLAGAAGAASRGGSRGGGAGIPRPARGRRGAACRDTRRSDTSVRRSGQP